MNSKKSSDGGIQLVNRMATHSVQSGRKIQRQETPSLLDTHTAPHTYTHTFAHWAWLASCGPGSSWKWSGDQTKRVGLFCNRWLDEPCHRSEVPRHSAEGWAGLVKGWAHVRGGSSCCHYLLLDFGCTDMQLLCGLEHISETKAPIVFRKQIHIAASGNGIQYVETMWLLTLTSMVCQ